MSFAVGADAYGAFMGRFSEPLALRFADVAGVTGPPAGPALDVGCGTGALTRVLVDRLGADRVCAVDPSPPFVAAMRERFPDVDVRAGRAEALPFDDGAFDAVLAQLVVHFMTDPVGGLAEMVRAARPGGVVAACVWDHGGGTGPLARSGPPSARATRTRRRVRAARRPGGSPRRAPHGGRRDRSDRRGDRRRGSARLLRRLVGAVHARRRAGRRAYVAGARRRRPGDLRERCRARVPQGPSSTTARAWVGRGHAPR